MPPCSRAVDPSTQAQLGFGNFFAAGPFGARLRPVRPRRRRRAAEGHAAHDPLDRLDDRRQLLAELDGVKR